MPFTNPSYPGQEFKTFEEFQERRRLEKEAHDSIDATAERAEEITKVTATIIPAEPELVERRVVELEKKVDALARMVADEPTENKEGLMIGTILRGESRGNSYTLETLDEGYLCSDGNIYDSLSGAALGVSGNRRSGWKFWKDVAGIPIGEITGRFRKNASHNPFDTRSMS